MSQDDALEPQQDAEENATSAASGDAQSAPFWEQMKTFTRTYWIANWMELVERFAYYGVRTVLPVFMVLAISEGGPELDHRQKATIYGMWAVVQSLLPIFTGGFADRYGYKLNIVIATVLKMVGYLVMGFCIQLAEMAAGTDLASARAEGIDHVYGIFFAGAMFLAAGTAVFKPGLQGLIALEIPKKSASLGWSVFYQMVNWGGFIGPLIAGYLRVLEWEYVFLACTVGIALNFIPLFFFREPERPKTEEDEKGALQILWESLSGLLEPRLFFFTISFAAFWLMFYQLFDILPNFIDDWVDSRDIASSLGSWVPATDEGNLTQEWMININAGMIMLTAFIVGFFTGKVRSLTAIVLGIGVSAVGIYMLGFSMNGWVTIGAIMLFSFGEMCASPTKMRYLASIAPKGKDGLYMGYANFTVGIGWALGSVVAGEMYETGGDKINLAKRYLVEQGQDAEMLEEMDRGSVLQFAQETLGVDGWELRELLWNEYSPQSMWLVFALIGLGSLVFLLAYDRIVQHANQNPGASFNVNGPMWVRVALIPIVAVFVWASFSSGSMPVYSLLGIFSAMFAATFFQKSEPEVPPQSF